MEPMSFVKATKDFFEKEPNGRKVEVPEFKALSQKDREEIREGLIELGYDVMPLVPAPS